MINQNIHPINIFESLPKTEKERRDRDLIDAIAESMKGIGLSGDDISYQIIKTLKKIGRYDLLPPCERCGDAFLHYSAALYRTIASKECLPSA